MLKWQKGALGCHAVILRNAKNLSMKLSGGLSTKSRYWSCLSRSTRFLKLLSKKIIAMDGLSNKNMGSAREIADFDTGWFLQTHDVGAGMLYKEAP